MLTQHKISLKATLLLGAIAAVGMYSPASADSIETVIVTGTAIASSDAMSAAPLSIVTSDAILKSKTVTLEQILNKLPEMGQQGSNDQNSISPGGISTVDLRALGSNRTLILIDGQRMVSTFVNGGQGQDLSNVPVSMIDHIDVLKDGASPMYGADAIAGVINIITKKDFEGLELTGGSGISTYGDHFTKELSATLGITSSKGGVLVGLESYTEDPVRQGTRVWAGGGDGSEALYTFSSASPEGRYTGFTTGTRYWGQDNNTIGLVCPSGNALDQCPVFNTGVQPDLIQGRQVLNANALAHYDFSDTLQAFAQVYFTNRKAEAQLNPEPIGDIYTTAKYPGGTIIPATNPNNTTGEDLAVRKRLFEVGDREFFDATNTYQLRAGLKGTLWGNWQWEAGYNWGESDSLDGEHNAVNLTHMHELTGEIPCEASAPAGCGGVTLAGVGSLTPAQVAYVRYTSVNTSKYEEDTAYANITGDTGIALPGGTIGVAAGIDWRREFVSAIPDSTKQFGDDAEGTTAITGGGYYVREVNGEVKLPLLKDLPFVQNLSVDISGRYSDYSNFGGAGVYKVAANWEVTDFLRFRGDYGTGVRAPQVGGELYLGAEQSAIGFVDPCPGASNATIKANCAAVIPGYTPGTFTQDVPQLTGTVVGNSALKPETSNQYNLGLVVTPDEIVPRLAFTADYYHIAINNVITTLDVGTILSQCYQSVGFSSPYCSLIGPRSASGKQLNTVFIKYLNLGYLHTDGIDFGLTYNTDIGDSFLPVPEGTNLAFDAKAHYLNNFNQEGLVGNVTPYAGQWTEGAAISTAFPKWKAVLGTTITFPFGLDLTWTERLVGATTDGCTSGCAAGENIPALMFSDLSVSYPWDNYTTTFGIDNVFDKDPPLGADIYVQSVSNQYDFVGRFFFLKLTAKY